MPKISVIIPAFNRALTLPRALTSVLSQRDADFEVLVVDDGSTDETSELIHRDFPSVKLLRQNNLGVSAARNAGIRAAQGEWLAFLDSDDEWMPGMLKSQLDFFDAHPDYKIAQTEEIWIRNSTRVNPMNKHKKYGGWIFEKCLPLCAISPSAVMIHRSIFDDVGTFDETYPACEDYELWLRIASKYPVGLIEKPGLTRYGGHEDQLSKKYPAMDQFRIRALLKILSTGNLNAEQTQAAASMLIEKSEIFLQGAEKRGKHDEAAALEKQIAPYRKFARSIPQKTEEKTRYQPEEISLFSHLTESDQIFLRSVYDKYPLTFQEFRNLVIISRDLAMWSEAGLESWWQNLEASADPAQPFALKSELPKLLDRYESLKKSAKEYRGPQKTPSRDSLRITTVPSDKKIYGDCPVASEETVCCNLKTIDAVENCGFGCSYCTIQTFYGNEAVFDGNFAEKLRSIPIDPNRYVHFGTGQSSDSLIWGNRNGNLDALCDFARAHPNVLLELKTKSDNISYFREHPAPKNLVISWSLNPETIIQNEEHFTASLDRRLTAARQAADLGIPVAFHFHPMVYYSTWENDYPNLAIRVQAAFRKEEVLFMSFGSVTFIKPVMQAIRERGESSRILQMELVRTAKNKYSYPEDLKIKMFQTMYRSFQPWAGKVFMYLCMEEAKFWDEVFGSHYATNEAFEADFGRQCFEKIYGKDQLPNPLWFEFGAPQSAQATV